MSDAIINFIQDQLIDDSDITLSVEDDLLGSGLIDSIGIMKLIGFIESEFEVKVPPEDMVIEHFMTVEDISNYLTERKQA